jgi:uncharacterized protein (TIGR03083 family)
MELTRRQITSGLFEEYEAFAALLDELDPEARETPTRCTEWRVCDVAGHVVGGAVDAATGASGSRGADDQARDLRDEPSAVLAGRLRRASAGIARFLAGSGDAEWAMSIPAVGLTLEEGIHALWQDAYVHFDDVRAALDLPERRGASLGGTVAWLAGRLAQNGWGPATLALDDMPEYSVGTGSGPVVGGDPLRFALVATGRADPAEAGLDRLGLAEGVDVYSVR